SAARLAPGQDEAWRVHAWHTGQPPPARATHALIYRAPWIFFTGMHLGGPLVTPASVRDGLFRLPPAGRGMVTSPSVSFGRYGLWAGDDYGAGDDVTELWWGATATGPDEAGPEPADALHGDPPRGQVGEVEIVRALGVLDRVLVERRRQAGGFEQKSDPPGELRAGRGGAVPGEEDVAVAPQAGPPPARVDDEALPEPVPVDQLEPPGLVEQVEPIGEAPELAAGVEERAGDAG